MPPRAMWRVPKPTRSPVPPTLDGLLEEGPDALPVRIEIVQDGATTGWDDGALGFDEDAFWFSGRACSFRVGAPDILPGAYRFSRHEAVTNGEALDYGFPLRHPTREVWVRVRVLTTDETARRRDNMRVATEIKRLREPLSPGGKRGEGSGNTSEYPPLTPRPGLYRGIRLTRSFPIVRGIAVALLLLQGILSVALPKLTWVRFGMLLPIAPLLILSGLLEGDERLKRFVEGDAEAAPPSLLDPPPSP